MRFHRRFLSCFFLPLFYNFEILHLLVAPSFNILLHPSNKLLCLHVFIYFRLLLLIISSDSDDLWRGRFHVLLLFLADRGIKWLQLDVIRLCNDLHVLLFLFKCLESPLFLHFLFLFPLKLLLPLQERLNLITVKTILLLRTHKHPRVWAATCSSFRGSGPLSLL